MKKLIFLKKTFIGINNFNLIITFLCREKILFHQNKNKFKQGILRKFLKLSFFYVNFNLELLRH